MFRLLVISLLVLSSTLLDSAYAATGSSLPVGGCGSSGLYGHMASAVCAPTMALTNTTPKTIQSTIDSSAAVAARSTNVSTDISTKIVK